jgi:hypothetical protein
MIEKILREAVMRGTFKRDEFLGLVDKVNEVIEELNHTTKQHEDGVHIPIEALKPIPTAYHNE